MSQPFFTVGHSNRGLEAFIALLAENRIDAIADVRRLPGSRACPQFDAGTLAPALTVAGMSYAHFPALGGRRGRSADIEPAVNGFWTNASFHNYADYALTTEFQAALRELRRAGRGRCAIMCAEAVWWRCHRRIIADYLIVAGDSVFHLMGQGRSVMARLTPGASILPDGRLVYPAAGAAAAAAP